LDRVFMVVAGDPWQKQGEVVATAADRLAMVAAAAADVDGVEASAIEIERSEPSVSYDTLVALGGPGRELVLVLGAHAVRHMPTWRKLEGTREGAALVTVGRAGHAP